MFSLGRMYPRKRTSERWLGLALVAAFSVSACGGGTDDAIATASTPAPTTPASTTAATRLDQTEGSAASAGAATEAPLTLPAPSAGVESSAEPDDGSVGATSAPNASSTVPQTPTTAPGLTAQPTSSPPTQASTTTPGSTGPTTQPPPAANRFPDVSVVDLASRQTVSMAARLGGSGRPVLLWFWSPF